MSTLDYQRQKDLFDPSKAPAIMVVGTGAVGRNVCMTLAAMGVKSVVICDMDTVDASNVATQGFPAADIGIKKVDSLVRSMTSVNPEISIQTNSEPWNPRSAGAYDVIISCVDKMDVRRSLFLFAKKHGTKHFLDGRMLAEMAHVFYYDNHNISEYEKTLFKDEDAIQGRCTARGTLYMAQILANLIVGRLAMALRGEKGTNRYTFNLLGELG